MPDSQLRGTLPLDIPWRTCSLDSVHLNCCGICHGPCRLGPWMSSCMHAASSLHHSCCGDYALAKTDSRHLQTYVCPCAYQLAMRSRSSHLIVCAHHSPCFGHTVLATGFRRSLTSCHCICGYDWHVCWANWTSKPCTALKAYVALSVLPAMFGKQISCLKFSAHPVRACLIACNCDPVQYQATPNRFPHSRLICPEP